MSDYPRLFKDWSVRAILAGTKVQTRRPVTRSNSLVDGSPTTAQFWAGLDFSQAWLDAGPSPAGNPGPYLKVPQTDNEHFPGDTVHRIYSRIWDGDRIWGREKWRVCGWWEGESLTIQGSNEDKWDCDGDSSTPGFEEWEERMWEQCMDDCEKAGAKTDENGYYQFGDGKAPTRWRPSIFMPKCACRLWLPVTQVRLQRVQEITEEDARAEGVGMGYRQDGPGTFARDSYTEGFRGAWDSIYADKGHGWEANDWVWAYTFDQETP